MVFSYTQRILDIHNLLHITNSVPHPSYLFTQALLFTFFIFHSSILRPPWFQFQGCTAGTACQSCYEGGKTSQVCQRLKQVSCLNLCLPVKAYSNKLSLFFSLPLCCWYWLNGTRCMFTYKKHDCSVRALFLSKRLII